MTLTTVLATYGALLSSIGFGWNLFRDLQDRPKVKVVVSLKRIVQSEDGSWYACAPDLPVEGASERVFVYFTITNIGRRPVRVTGMGGRYRAPKAGRKNFVLITSNLPKLLAEGEGIHEFNDNFHLVSGNVKRLFAYDSNGRNWYVSCWNLKNVMAEVEKYLRGSDELS